MQINLDNNYKSLERPAWTQDNLYAYRNKYCYRNGKYIIIKDYFVKSKGLAWRGLKMQDYLIIIAEFLFIAALMYVLIHC